MSKYKKAMMRTAFVWAEESHCKRRQVGAVIERDGHILDTGYNGTISGAENSCEDEVYTCEECQSKASTLEELGETVVVESAKHFGKVAKCYCRKCNHLLAEATSPCRPNGMSKTIKAINPTLITNDFTIHAEQNIISNCAKEGISLKGATMYITTSPCKICAKLIANSGIVKVFYADEYKDQAGVKYLNDLNIKTELYKVKEA